MTDPIDPTDVNEVGVSFLRTEIETGLTFADLAIGATDDPEKRSRNRTRAETAYAALLKFLPRVDLTGEDEAGIPAGTERLRLAIAAIPD